jgi:hypothetical protein
MKIKIPVLILALFLIFFACSKKDNVDTTNAVSLTANNASELSFFTKEDISKMKLWLKNFKGTKDEYLKNAPFPKISFNVEPSSTEKSRLQYYQNGILYTRDNIQNGVKTDFNIIITMINGDDSLDKNGKIFLLSLVQLTNELLLSKETIDFFKFQNTDDVNKPKLKVRSCGDCSNLSSTANTYWIQCQVYGNVWGHCDAYLYWYNQYLNCVNQQPICPSGFSYDGANCYSGVHFPPEYEGFVFGNGFYTTQNCSVSTANNCCPPGFGYDGANCHYWGLYFPPGYEAFIWNECFYVQPICQ